MSIFTRLAAAGRALVAPEQRASVADWQRPEGWVITNGRNIADVEHIGGQVRVAWERHPVVQSCARLIADHIAAVPLEVYVDGEDGPQVVPDHPLQDLLDHPTPLMSAFRFRGMTALNLLLYGNAFWHEVRGPVSGSRRFGLPTRLDLVLPELTRFAYWSPEAGQIVRWDWVTEHTGTLMETPATDMVHFADYGSDSTVVGYPRAASALGDIVADQDASRYVREVLKNDGSPNLVFHMAEMVGKDAAEQAQALWQEKRAARGQRGMAAFLPATLKVEQLGFSLADLEFPDLRRVSREDICSVFSVDPRMVSISSAAKDSGLSGQQYTEARRRLIAQAVAPLMFLIEGQLNHWLTPEYGKLRVRFSPSVLTEMTENEGETSTKAMAEFNAGVRTFEEAREAVGLDGEADPTHYLASPGNHTLRTVKLALEIAAEKPEPLPALPPGTPPGSAPATPPKPKGDTETKALPPTLFSEELLDDDATIMTRTALTPEQRVAIWSAFDQAATKEEAPLVKAALAQFAVDKSLAGKTLAANRSKRAEPIAITQAEANAIIAAINELFREGGPVQEGWQERFGPLEMSIGVRAAEEWGERVGLAVTIDEHFRAALAARGARLARYVGPSTAQQIVDTILLGRTQGLTLDQIAALIDETVFGGLEAGRAATIARTETVGAINEAEWRAARANPAIQSKEWLTQQDDVVRDSHTGCEAQGPIDFDAQFVNGLQYPHDPTGDADEVVNCRCVLFYSTATEEG